MDNYESMMGEINSKEDFIRFMTLYAAAAKKTNADVAEFIEASANFVESMDGPFFGLPGMEIPENMDWNFLANVFYAGGVAL